jgi:hypothetical protein
VLIKSILEVKRVSRNRTPSNSVHTNNLRSNERSISVISVDGSSSWQLQLRLPLSAGRLQAASCTLRKVTQEICMKTYVMTAAKQHTTDNYVA